MSKSNPFERPPGLAANCPRHKHAPEPLPYIPTPELIEAVNLAIYLNRPLLLEGEAGSGKSQLAKYLAACLGLPFHPWLVRSTSSAQDGLYSYDAILRLHDVHIAQLQGKDDKKDKKAPRDPQQPMDYVSWGALGKAFHEQQCPAVVLIDEIDKADIDFPNDLLTVLDEPRTFHITEADQHAVSATHAPIVIITSNKEKANLPAPFLRRCIYSYIAFPSSSEELEAIIAAHQTGNSTANAFANNAELSRAAVERFLALRAREDLFKKPGTSELLDWLQALARKVGGRSSGKAVTQLIAQLKDPDALLPCPELLFKLRVDWKRHVPAR